MELRKASGLPQKEIARRMGVSRQQIYNFERGERGLSVERLHRFCEIYGVNATEILSNGRKSA